MNANEISELRKSLKMSREKFADVFGVSPRTVANWESGSKVIPLIAQKFIELYIASQGNNFQPSEVVAHESGSVAAYNSTVSIVHREAQTYKERLDAAKEKIALLERIINEKERLIQALRGEK